MSSWAGMNGDASARCRRSCNNYDEKFSRKMHPFLHHVLHIWLLYNMCVVKWCLRVKIWTLTWSSQLNIEAVNDAYNSILIDEEDYNTLQDSIDSFDRYDPVALAKKLEKCPVLEFRRLAAHLYKVWTSAMVWVFVC